MEHISAILANCWWMILLSALIAYLLGSINTAVLVTGIVTKGKKDIRQMGSGNLFGTGKLLQQGVDRGNMQRRNELFQLWKQDADQSSDRAFQLGTLFHLVKTVSGQ